MFYTIQKYQPSGWKSCAKVFNNTEKFDDVGEGPATKYMLQLIFLFQLIFGFPLF